MEGLNVPRVAHRFVAVDGVRVFYREAGPPDAPTMLLLHGFPSASHQFRRLIDALGGRYRLIAPDYPSFGYSDAPAAASVGVRSARRNHVFSGSSDHVLRDVRQVLAERSGIR
jgi:pimeloyl-ACP methyl ester carboxylesterase